MALERGWQLLVAIGAVALVGMVLLQAGVLPAPWSADEGEVRVVDAGDDREPKAVVDVEVADTRAERYTGLSEHESLAEGEGMLFVHGDERERTYVMREMDFDIDIVFVGADRRITSIERARAPESGEDGEDLRYSGRAQWVLEVPRGYANETGMAVGDEVRIDLHEDDGLSLAVLPEASDSSAATGGAQGGPSAAAATSARARRA